MRLLRAALVGATLLLVVAGSVTGTFAPFLGPAAASAASPEPSTGAGDTRSTGEAPGFVGAPLLAIGAVLAIGALALLGTIAYVRLTGGPGRITGDDAAKRS